MSNEAREAALDAAVKAYAGKLPTSMREEASTAPDLRSALAAAIAAFEAAKPAGEVVADELVHDLCKWHETLLARSTEHVAVVDGADLMTWAALVLSAATRIDRASRAALAASPVPSEPPLVTAQRGFDTWAAKPHNKKWVHKLDGTPIPNDLVVCIAEAFRGTRP